MGNVEVIISNPSDAQAGTALSGNSIEALSKLRVGVNLTQPVSKS